MKAIDANDINATDPSGVLDPARLTALAAYDILDTAPEPEFDDVVNIAQKICNTPVALVSLVDANRQWFKARVGFAVCDTPLEQSVCAHALKEDDLLVIPDLTGDERTRENTLVTGVPFIRFYAGVVLRSPEGHALGTLCVIDSKPRPEGITFEQADALRALGRQTMVVMGMRRAVQERADALAREREAREATVDHARNILADRERLRREQLRQKLAQEAGGIGTFEIDVSTDRCFVSAHFCKVYGLPAIDECDTADWQHLVLPADRHLLSTREARQDGTAVRDIEFRISRKSDGAVRWISRRTEFLADSEGEVKRMFGVVQDITERKLAEGKAIALVRLGDSLREASTANEVIKITGMTLGTTLVASRAGLCFIDGTKQDIEIKSDWSASRYASIAGRYSTKEISQTLARLVEGGPVVVANIPAASWMQVDAPVFERMLSKAKVTIPLFDQGRLAGFVYAHDASPRTWTTAEVDFVQAVGDRAFAVIKRIDAEDRQRVLNLELSHRLKNTLAMVQAIASQTLRKVEERSAVRAFEDRLIALSRAHDVLLRENWSATQIEAVVASVVQLHGDSGRIKASGPHVSLGPKTTLSMSLLLHELATNAAKYGALSCQKGWVKLTWEIDGEGAQAILRMAWQECDGPPASQPQGRGFGSRLIAMGLAGTGGAKLDYAATGLNAHFSAPLITISETS